MQKYFAPPPPSYPGLSTYTTTTRILFYPPRDGKGFKGFLPHWTNSILQQLKRKFWKNTDVLFRISWMTNSFKYRTRHSVLSLRLSTRPSHFSFFFWNCEAFTVPGWNSLKRNF
jgi:hypothetical protein